MAREKRLELVITGDARKAQKALNDLDAAAGKSQKATGKALDGIKGKMLDLGVAAGAMFAFNEWNESQKVAKQTEAVLKSTGAQAWETADAVGDLANEISRKTGIDDEAIQSAQNWLLTFKKVRNEAGEGNDVFDRTTRTMIDLSVAMKGDAKQAANLLGKALNDPVKGISALTRVGVTFSASQKEQIKQLVEQNDLLGAQKIILDEVESQVEGSAEAQATAAFIDLVAERDEHAEGGAGEVFDVLERKHEFDARRIVDDARKLLLDLVDAQFVEDFSVRELDDLHAVEVVDLQSRCLLRHRAGLQMGADKVWPVRAAILVKFHARRQQTDRRRASASSAPAGAGWRRRRGRRHRNRPASADVDAGTCRR